MAGLHRRTRAPDASAPTAAHPRGGARRACALVAHHRKISALVLALFLVVIGTAVALGPSGRPSRTRPRRRSRVWPRSVRPTRSCTSRRGTATHHLATALEACVDPKDANCLAPVGKNFDPAKPLSLDSTTPALNNFPDEFFYFDSTSVLKPPPRPPTRPGSWWRTTSRAPSPTDPASRRPDGLLALPRQGRRRPAAEHHLHDRAPLRHGRRSTRAPARPASSSPRTSRSPRSTSQRPCTRAFGPFLTWAPNPTRPADARRPLPRRSPDQHSPSATVPWTTTTSRCSARASAPARRPPTECPPAVLGKFDVVRQQLPLQRPVQPDGQEGDALGRRRDALHLHARRRRHDEARGPGRVQRRGRTSSRGIPTPRCV